MLALAYLVLSVVVAWAFRRSMLRFLTPRAIPGIPAYSDSVAILGDLPRMSRILKAGGAPIDFFDQVAKDLGPIAQIRLGFERMVVLTDYPSAESVLTKQTQAFDRGMQIIRVFRTIIPRALISLPTDDTWKHHRRIIGTAMTSKYLSRTTPRANEAIHALVRLWRRKAQLSRGRAFATDVDMECATMDAICGMAFGHSWDNLGFFASQLDDKEYPTGPTGEVVYKHAFPPLTESTLAIFDSLPISSPFPSVTHALYSLLPAYRRHKRRITAFLDTRLAESRRRAAAVGADAAVDGADNTLDLMVARQMRGDDWMPDAELRDEIFQYLVAGTETSGVALSWWLKYMTNHPDVQRKLRAHLLDTLPEMQDRPPRFEDLNATATPYLEAVVQETLRLSRTAGGYSREATEDVVVLGKVIPKGWTVIILTSTGLEDQSTLAFAPPAAVSGAAANSDNEKNASVSLGTAAKMDALLAPLRPEGVTRKVGYWRAGTGSKFDPERWLDDKGEMDFSAGPSLPFSAGQRGCFGKNLALLELRLFIAQLNLNFFFAPVSDGQNSFDHVQTVTTHPRQCFIRPVSWESAEADAHARV